MQSMLNFFERPCETFCQTECATDSEALSGGHCAICAYMCPNVYAGGKTWIVRTANPSDTDIYLSTDTGYRYDLTFDEATDLARRAIFAATYRDAYSGGTVRVYHIDANGWKRITEDDSMVRLPPTPVHVPTSNRLSSLRCVANL